MKRKVPWIATVILESKKKYGKTSNIEREKALLNIISETAEKTKNNGIILFAAGYFHTKSKRASEQNYKQWVQSTKKLLASYKNRNIVVCFGIDGGAGRYPNDSPKDQIALAISKKGVIAKGRKFHPVEGERDKIELAPNYTSGENGKPRTFSMNGKIYYLAVCYDLFGLKATEIKNPGVDNVLNFTHKFTKRCSCNIEDCGCQAASGDVNYARHGLAGASKNWKCPIYCSVVFFKRKVPTKWPSGILWNKGNINTRKWRYTHNAIKTPMSYYYAIPEGNALTRIYNSPSSF